MCLESPGLGVFMRNILRGVAKASKHWPGFERISAKLMSIEGLVFEKACAAHAYSTDNFTILTHGDLWVNNLLFKYNENGQPIDVRLVSMTSIVQFFLLPLL